MTPESSEIVRRQAADWLARQDRGLTAAEVAALAQWQAADPRRGAELAILREEWRRLDRATELPELAALAEQLVATPTPRQAERHRMRVLAWSFGLAAAAVVAFAVWAGAWRAARSPAVAPTVAADYRVVPHAARLLTLEDGSVVELRGDSEVRADFTPTERRVALVRGEAHFKVTKNPARPFIVTAGPVAVRAVGTAFNVRLGAAAVDVLVTEGKVRVDGVAPASAGPVSLLPAEPAGETPVLAAGQSVKIALVADAPAPAATIARLEPAEVDQELAWQSTWLVFARTPLEQAVAAFNREAGGARPPLVLADATLRGRRLGGTFRADNPEGFVRLLEQGFDIRAERQGDQILLHAVR